jgi:hypothetical protein
MDLGLLMLNTWQRGFATNWRGAQKHSHPWQEVFRRGSQGIKYQTAEAFAINTLSGRGGNERGQHNEQPLSCEFMYVLLYSHILIFEKENVVK